MLSVWPATVVLLSKQCGMGINHLQCKFQLYLAFFVIIVIIFIWLICRQEKQLDNIRFMCQLTDLQSVLIQIIYSCLEANRKQVTLEYEKYKVNIFISVTGSCLSTFLAGSIVNVIKLGVGRYVQHFGFKLCHIFFSIFLVLLRSSG